MNSQLQDYAERLSAFSGREVSVSVAGLASLARAYVALHNLTVTRVAGEAYGTAELHLSRIRHLYSVCEERFRRGCSRGEETRESVEDTSTRSCVTRRPTDQTPRGSRGYCDKKRADSTKSQQTCPSEHLRHMSVTNHRFECPGKTGYEPGEPEKKGEAEGTARRSRAGDPHKEYKKRCEAHKRHVCRRKPA